jgi:hypothetical protein
MSVSIMQALQNADYNLQKNGDIWIMEQLYMLAKDQLHNAVTLLNKGYDIEDEIEPLLEKYGCVDKVPEKAD